MKLTDLADRLILFPTRGPVSVTGDAVRAKLPNTDLDLWIHRPTGQRFSGMENSSKPRLYLFHLIGNASRAEWEQPIFLELLAEHYQVEAWVLNYPGYGSSPGQAKLSSFPMAAFHAFQAVRQRAGNHHLLLSGNSLGASVALCLAARYPVRGLILLNPPPIQNMILNRFGWWNLWLIAGPIAAGVPRELNSLINAGKCHCPAVFFTSEKDRTVPPQYQRKIMERYAGPYQQVVIPNASHDTGIPDPLKPQAELALTWLIQTDA